MASENKVGLSWAPYAPPATVLGVIRHFRERDVPERIEEARLTQIGVTDGLLKRTWAALIFLGLILEDGTTTEEFRNLRYASDVQYPDVLKGLIHQRYEGIFQVIDPDTADEFALDNAFRPYSPGGQRPRMITLFLSLCTEAGYKPTVKPRERSSVVKGGGGKRVEKRDTSKGTASPGSSKKNEGGTPPAPPVQPLDDIKKQYAELLLERVRQAEGEPSEELLDRLERALGINEESKVE